MLSQRQKEILVGTMLGDGHLEQNGRGVRLRVDHGMAQQDYVLWKYQEFQKFATNRPRVIKSFHKKSRKFMNDCISQPTRTAYFRTGEIYFIKIK